MIGQQTKRTVVPPICIFLLFISMMVNLPAMSQEIVKDKEYYLQRSKNQKTAGMALLIGGGVAIGAGLLIGNSSESSFDDAATGAVIGGVGVLAMLGSIPLFIASGKNKRKAARMVGTTKIPAYYFANRKIQFQAGLKIDL